MRRQIVFRNLCKNKKENKDSKIDNQLKIKLKEKEIIRY